MVEKTKNNVVKVMFVCAIAIVLFILGTAAMLKNPPPETENAQLKEANTTKPCWEWAFDKSITVPESYYDGIDGVGKRGDSGITSGTISEEARKELEDNIRETISDEYQYYEMYSKSDGKTLWYCLKPEGKIRSKNDTCWIKYSGW